MHFKFVAILILLELTLQFDIPNDIDYLKYVAILILLELTLQLFNLLADDSNLICRNPYFIGINSAILILKIDKHNKTQSQSLFYWN